MPLTARQIAKRWQERENVTLRSARLLFEAGQWHDTVSRSYYAAYQAAAGLCVLHGDAFPCGWINPTHDQLPELILKNGDLPLSARRQVSANLVLLRTMRESADYRPGHTINYSIALECVQRTVTVLLLLGAMEEAE